jgi:hypothetical protein
MHKVAVMSDEYDVRNINNDENRSKKLKRMKEREI